jgi:hypothetical protein
LDGTSRLAWSKVPVTITSLASVCGLFLSRRERFNEAEKAKNTIIRHGAPSENDLMEVLVLCRHDGEVELARVSASASALELEGDGNV